MRTSVGQVAESDRPEQIAFLFQRRARIVQIGGQVLLRSTGGNDDWHLFDTRRRRVAPIGHWRRIRVDKYDASIRVQLVIHIAHFKLAIDNFCFFFLKHTFVIDILGK